MQSYKLCAKYFIFMFNSLFNNFTGNKYNAIFAPMFKKGGFSLVSLIALFVLLSSCSNYQRLLKSTNNDMKYESAVKYYEKKDYARAEPLFEQLLTINKGTSKYEMTYYYYAYCYFGEGDYEEGSFYFDGFVNTFPSSKFAEECTFMSAFCFYMGSPSSSLDQTNTRKAMDRLQIFANKYPKSTKVDQCNQLIDLLREKLQKKDYNNAKLYYKMSDYRASSVCFKNIVKTYPDTKYKEECLFLVVKSYYLWASNSIENKKEERYKSCIESYTTFIDNCPNSKYIKEAESYYDNSLKQLDKKHISGKISLGN